jgi:hypothetical protein
MLGLKQTGQSCFESLLQTGSGEVNQHLTIGPDL